MSARPDATDRKLDAICREIDAYTTSIQVLVDNGQGYAYDRKRGTIDSAPVACLRVQVARLTAQYKRIREKS
jgi:hypothetical protein